MSDLRALAERLEKATGPSDPCIRGLDFQDALAKHLFGFRFTVEDSGQVRDAFSSLDAAVALCERVLPGWGFFLRKDEDGCNVGMLYPVHNRVTPGSVRHPTSPALALCLAIVRAKMEAE